MLLRASTDGTADKRIIRTAIPYVILAAASLLVLVRSFYSFSWSDESFYLTMVHRLWLGERMFADEWYTTQLSAPLLLPFYALYQWITGGNEGVYLYFRLLYWGISTGTALYAFQVLKKRNNRAGSLACALLYLFYSRANIGGMSYYNMTLTLVLLASLLIYEQLCRKCTSNRNLFAVGILLALAVVFTPFLVLPYFLVAGCLLLIKKYRKYYRSVLVVIAGSAVAAACYLTYVFRQVTLADIFLNLPHILNEPELQSTNPVLVLPLMAARIVWRFKWTIGILALLTGYVWWKRRQPKELGKRELYVIGGLNLALFLGNVWLSGNLIGCVNIAIMLFLIPTAMLCGNVRQTLRNEASVFGIAGGSVALAFSFSSDTGLDAMTIGFVLIGIAGILLVLSDHRIRRERLLYGSVMLAVCMAVLQTGYLRFFSVYRDAPLKQLDTQITSGPAKYLYTTKKHVEQYEQVKAAIAEYVREEDTVFYSKWCFWSYLCTDNAYGVPSSWRMPFDSPRLEEYYQLRPDKIPSFIFVLNPSYGDYTSSLIQGNERADRPNENNLQGFLWDYIQDNAYERIELECGVIYRSVK